MGSRVRFINPRRSTRSPSWVPMRVISSYTVPYGCLYGSPGRNICPTLPHIEFHESLVNPRRPTRSPLWFPVWGISSHTVPYGFLYGPACRQFLPIPTHGTLLFPMRSHGFPSIPMQSHAETHIGICNRDGPINLNASSAGAVIISHRELI